MRKQRGVTMIGWIFLLIPMAMVLYAGIRVGSGIPELLQGASRAMKETADELKSDETLTPQHDPHCARAAFRYRLRR